MRDSGDTSCDCEVSLYMLQFREEIYLTEIHKIPILQMIACGDGTRTQAEVIITPIPRKISGVAADISRYRKLNRKVVSGTWTCTAAKEKSSQ
ncbi:hypothetical protein NQ318_000486 [Aromia moschata]|uniref:Uncharacterized protein n=1 Tax=Aromia moschata TaxID=1265417 RepID=A0AAV8X7K6_9CUCU|nr:hypothetical protein NQ318_000486 [Aromia moschata]